MDFVANNDIEMMVAMSSRLGWQGCYEATKEVDSPFKEVDT